MRDFQIVRQDGIMRLTRIRAVRLMAAGAFCLGGLFPAAARGDTADDMQLTLAARAALTRDRTLATLNLGVRVQDGVATLFGPVPAAECGERAQNVLKGVTGLKTITSEIHVLPPADPIAEKMNLALEKAKDAASPPAPVVLAPVPGMPAPPTPEEASNERRAAKPAPHVVPGSVPSPGTIVRASAVLLEPTVAPKPPAGLAARIDGLKQADKRYDGLRIDIENGIVRLSGNLQTWNDLWSFADAVSCVPGVERVVIDRIETK